MHRHIRVISACFLLSLVSLLSAADTIKVACVGDSITFGAGVEQRDINNYPVVLGKILGEKYETKNFGVSGATLLKKGDKPYWKLPEFKRVSEFKPNVIVIKLGTNDTKPQNWKFKDEFATDLAEMVDQFAALPSKPKIYLCIPVPAYEAKWGINEPTLKDGVIPAVLQVAKAKNLSTIDLHTALSDKAALFPDKIHPNAAGAKIIAETVAAAISK